MLLPGVEERSLGAVGEGSTGTVEEHGFWGEEHGCCGWPFYSYENLLSSLGNKGNC